MVLFQLMGGLGNQMFQYAAAKSLSLESNIPVKFFFRDTNKNAPRDYGLHVLSCNLPRATNCEIERYLPPNRIIQRLNNLFPFRNEKLVFKEKNDFIFDPSFFDVQNEALYYGFWQTENYFSKYEDEIRRDFNFSVKPSFLNSELIIKLKLQQSVAVHIRRGDYVSQLETNELHGICPIKYYIDSIEYVTERLDKPIFYFFSDDIDWVRNNFSYLSRAFFVDFNGGISSYEDLRLMSLCKHNIIANSSFSWWGAWLNSNPEKIVIAPKMWMTNIMSDTVDIIPKSWITI
jgi:hypothetical protein